MPFRQMVATNREWLLQPCRGSFSVAPALWQPRRSIPGVAAIQARIGPIDSWLRGNDRTARRQTAL
ncbi:MAG TPA: hypothetical protein DDY91_22660 [Planctomycetaceae bacterium]|nr:hypothetical protein [Planctomycetaceae bacterium]